jgi:branched-chain amino acid transport system ATP-binding protein
MSALLQVDDLSVSFGSVRALADVNLTVPEGQLVGLIGPNGAGKTTFIDAVTGFVPASGAIVFDGEDVAALPPHTRSRRGLARTWQTIELFDDLTVRENLVVAARIPSFKNSLAEVVLGRRSPIADAVGYALRILELESVADRMPSELSQGERKLVGVARALAGRSKLIMLDEPAAGLDTRESQHLGRQLRRVVDEGIGMLLVDHDMGLVLNICDTVYVIDFGKVLAHGAPEQVRTNPDVLRAYLGGPSSKEDTAAAVAAEPSMAVAPAGVISEPTAGGTK